MRRTSNSKFLWPLCGTFWDIVKKRSSHKQNMPAFEIPLNRKGKGSTKDLRTSRCRTEHRSRDLLLHCHLRCRAHRKEDLDDPTSQMMAYVLATKTNLTHSISNGSALSIRNASQEILKSRHWKSLTSEVLTNRGYPPTRVGVGPKQLDPAGSMVLIHLFRHRSRTCDGAI